MRLSVVAICACLSSVLAAQRPVAPRGPRTHAPEPTTADITVRDVTTRMYIIAADSMEGRDTGKRGGLRSANYIAGELKRLGLEPAGDGGSYLQRIPWVRRAPDTTGTISAGTNVFRWGADYILVPKIGFALALGGQPFGGSFQATDVPTVFGGRIGDSTISPNDVRDRVVVFTAPAFAFWQRDNLRRYSTAKAIVVATVDAGVPAAMKTERETFWDSTGASGMRAFTVISMTNAAVGTIFGKPVSDLTIGATGLPLSGQARFIDRPTEAPAYNVVGIVRGIDPKRRNTYVGVTAHHDHVGMGAVADHDSVRAFNSVARRRGGEDPQPRNVTDAQWAAIRALTDSLHRANGLRPDSIFNGADDDGAGTVLGLEIAESFAANRPPRSVLFVFHTAEEKGLFGSQYYSDHPTVPRDSIVGLVNLDQVGRGGAEDSLPGGASALWVIGSRRRSTELGDIVERVNVQPAHRFALDYTFDRDGDPTNGYCRSDHYMYARYGIPVVFFVGAAWYIDLHMVSDEPQYVDFERTMRIGRLARDVALALAEKPERVVSDKPRPEPNAVCRQ